MAFGVPKFGTEDTDAISKSERARLGAVDTYRITSLLEKYNEQFSMGHSVSRMVFGGLPIEDQDEAVHQPIDVVRTQEFLQSFTLKQMQEQSAGILRDTGLEFQPARAGWSVHNEGASIEGSEVRLNLKDGKRFVAYLSALQPESLTPTQKEGLREVARVLTQQFISEYELDNAEDARLLQLMGNLGQIIQEYERLGKTSSGLPESISLLKNYLAIARNGYLREYRAAEDLALTKPFTKKGFVLRWHQDATPQLLQQKWDLVLRMLQVLSENGKAKEIYGPAKETAKEALDAAIADVTADKEGGGYEDRKTEFLAILKHYRDALSELNARDAVEELSSPEVRP